MAIIKLTDLEVSYGATKALQGVTCAIEGGGVGLLGPNGAGKSTLLKTLLGFIRAEAGEAAVLGHRLPEEALAVRQRLGYMPERDIIARDVSAVGFVTYCGQLFGMRRSDAMERAHEVLNYAGVGESRYRKMQTYSTGMAQRVKFAQALVHDPKLLLLDEPTNGLDPEGRVEMLELIADLVTKRRVAVLLSSHLLPDVEHVCDHVLVIHKGRIVRDETLGSLTAARENLFELGVRENSGAFCRTLEEAGCTLQTQPSGHLLVTKPAALAPRAFFEMARASGTQVRHFVPVRHRLEEVFMQAIGRV